MCPQYLESERLWVHITIGRILVLLLTNGLANKWEALHKYIVHTASSSPLEASEMDPDHNSDLSVSLEFCIILISRTNNQRIFESPQ